MKPEPLMAKVNMVTTLFSLSLVVVSVFGKNNLLELCDERLLVHHFVSNTDFLYEPPSYMWILFMFCESP
ncbi:hypothetical protein Leryth_027504 [Lithospermum erythrorhizon]|nr:hypothetical protein Leryth_027504 [Lithospermum erythrorhizon]